MPLQCIEYIQVLADKDGNKIDPARVGMPSDFPQDTRVILAFKSVGDKTEMTVTEFGLPVSQMGTFAEMGMRQTLEKLAAAIAGD